MAVSPALLAYMVATEEGQRDGGEIPSDKVRVFSVGSVNVRADKIPDDIGLIEWVSRLDSLTGTSKKHTQDYLLQNILDSYGFNLHKYDYPMSYEKGAELAVMEPRLEELKYLSSDMINENRVQLEQDLDALILDRFADDPAYPKTCPGE